MGKVRELVVTVRVPAGEVIAIAELTPSGERTEISQQDFAEFAAQGEEESLIAALEEAYAAGAEDVSGEEDETSVTILWDAAARQRVRTTVRRLILARALSRMANAAPEPKKPKPEKRSPPARKGTMHARGTHTEH